MNETIKQGGSDSGHWLWFLQRITGVGVLVTISIHWVVQHFMSMSPALPITYEEVIYRLSQPEFRVLYALFLVFALFHGFHGLWMVGRDYLHAQWSRIGLATILITASTILFVWGVTIVFTSYPPPIVQAGVIPP